MRASQIVAGAALAAGAAYSLYSGNTALVVFFTSLFAVAVLAPGLISRTSEVSIGDFRASFKTKIDGMAGLSDDDRRDLKARIDGAVSLDEALDIIASFAAKRIDKNG